MTGSTQSRLWEAGNTLKSAHTHTRHPAPSSTAWLNHWSLSFFKHTHTNTDTRILMINSDLTDDECAHTHLHTCTNAQGVHKTIADAFISLLWLCAQCTVACRQGSRVGWLWMGSLKRDVHKAALMWLTALGPAQSPPHAFYACKRLLENLVYGSLCVLARRPYFQGPTCTKNPETAELVLFYGEGTTQWSIWVISHCWVD